MDKFTELTSVAIPFPQVNVDTDIIMPSDFLKTVKWAGLGEHAFHSLRYNKDGSDKIDSIFNDSRFKGAGILIAGDNFGCGSSREHAPRGIADMGIRCVIAPSFADIFAQNAFKCGLLLIELPQAKIDELVAEAGTGAKLSVDLDKEQITTPAGANEPINFTTDPFRRYCLLNGFDQIDLTLQHEGEISSFEARQKLQQPWLYGDG